ncbi:MAG: hypothetical protein MOGMAGMI_01335 [Candidatus Omnitrophica bacterium]|nr:hypothetical protein [Candidatus Omnitrophota bacterium]
MPVLGREGPLRSAEGAAPLMDASLRDKLAFARSYLVILRETRLFDAELIDRAIRDLDEAAGADVREV